MFRLKKQYWLWLALLAAGLDAVFKFFALSSLPEQPSRSPFPIDIVLHKNPGIAFDIELGLPIVFILSFLILGWLLIDADKHWFSHNKRSVANLVIVIGALGNLVDRVIHGFTTDYLYVLTAVINISDILVLFGVLLLLRYTRNTTG